MEKNCNCNDECTCGDDCNCTEDNRCSPNCTCPEDKKKHHHHHHNHAHKDCGCEVEEKCDCGDDCDCHDHDCDCGDDCDCHDHDCDCHDHDCDCGDECDCGEVHPKTQEEAFAMYEKAFRQLEDALIKADKELQVEKKRADENGHIARSFRADLERFKARNANAEAELKEKANTDAALKILPVLDNFDQALSAAIDPSVAKGFVMIYNRLKECVSDLGITEIKVLGEVFDTKTCECIAKTKAPDKASADRVSRVFKTGYALKSSGKVIRPAVVEIFE